MTTSTDTAREAETAWKFWLDDLVTSWIDERNATMRHDVARIEEAVNEALTAARRAGAEEMRSRCAAKAAAFAGVVPGGALTIAAAIRAIPIDAEDAVQ